MAKPYLVTGGSGFLGAAIVNQLVRDGRKSACSTTIFVAIRAGCCRSSTISRWWKGISVGLTLWTLL